MNDRTQAVKDMASQWTTIEEAIDQSLGAASVAWTEYEGGRKFDDEMAKAISIELRKFMVHQFETVLDSRRSKGEKIVRDCILDEEPFFVFRARDIFSVMVLKKYLQALEEYGPDDPDFYTDIVHFIHELRTWQSENISKVRYPD